MLNAAVSVRSSAGCGRCCSQLWGSNPPTVVFVCCLATCRSTGSGSRRVRRLRTKSHVSAAATRPAAIAVPTIDPAIVLSEIPLELVPNPVVGLGAAPLEALDDKAVSVFVLEASVGRDVVGPDGMLLGDALVAIDVVLSELDWAVGPPM